MQVQRGCLETRAFSYPLSDQASYIDKLETQQLQGVANPTEPNVKSYKVQLWPPFKKTANLKTFFHRSGITIWHNQGNIKRVDQFVLKSWLEIRQPKIDRRQPKSIKMAAILEIAAILKNPFFLNNAITIRYNPIKYEDNPSNDAQVMLAKSQSKKFDENGGHFENSGHFEKIILS